MAHCLATRVLRDTVGGVAESCALVARGDEMFSVFRRETWCAVWLKSGRLRVGYLCVLVALVAHLQRYRHINYSQQQECSRSYSFSDEALSKTEESVYCVLNQHIVADCRCIPASIEVQAFKSNPDFWLPAAYKYFQKSCTL